jgi:hypothetical protein
MKESNTMIDLTDTKKAPTIKSTINISLGKFIKKNFMLIVFFSSSHN